MDKKSRIQEIREQLEKDARLSHLSKETIKKMVYAYIYGAGKETLSTVTSQEKSK